MKTEIVTLSQIKTNTSNPRQIRDEKFVKLINSILVFPRMLEIRPIVVDDTFVSLGGNMRHRALTSIAGMSIDAVAKRLNETRDYHKKTEAEKSSLLEYWKHWIEKPAATIIKASELSEQEKREFIIKDNTGFGEWDYDMLANDWESEELDDWGVDVWQENSDDDNKRNAWNKNQSFCDMTEKLKIHKKGAFYYLSFWESSEEGKDLTEIKSDNTMIDFFAAKFIEIIPAIYGKNLKSGGFCIITSPKRRHKEHNFASEICKTVSKKLDIKFYEDLIECKNKARINPDFSLKYKFPEKNVLVLDDIITTGSTLTAIFLLLKDDKNLHFIAGINNNV
jgi:phosphoribosylpyrophosphate synthetase